MSLDCNTFCSQMNQLCDLWWHDNKIVQIVLNILYEFRHIISVCYDMMTSSNGNIFRVTGPLCGEFTVPGEFPTQRPVTRSFDVYFDQRLNKRLCKQS